MTEVSKTSINMPEALHRRLKSACAERGTKFGTAIIDAVEQWLDGGAAQGPEISPAERVCVEKLLHILRSGDFSKVTGIQISLDAYTESLRPSPRN
jgi:hypothetical protein